MSSATPPPELLHHHRLLPEPKLVFSPGDHPAQHEHPLLGLIQHGPYARPASAPIRVATITVQGQAALLNGFLGQLRGTHEPSDRRTYVPQFPGFQTVFGMDLVPATDAHVDLAADTPGTGTDGQDRIVQALARALDRLHAIRDGWDVAVFLLPRAWERWREIGDGGFRLHDRLKAYAAPHGLPVQMLRQESALTYKHRASLAWRLGLALFAKAGGVPWRVAPTTPEETAYIGLAYAIRGGTGEFVTCCSQVLDAEGGGMEFVAYNVGAQRDLESPHLTRDEMLTVMARSAHLYQHRHSGRMPRRLSVHKTSPWRAEEVAGVLDAWSATPDIDCIEVQRSPWRAVALEANGNAEHGQPAKWPVSRGTMQQLSGRSALLWVNGTATRMSLQGNSYNPSVKGIPTPITLVRAAGHGPLETTASDVLALSKLDWNNDAPFDDEPVTIEYSRRLAQTIAHVPELPDNVYQYRLFM